MSGRQERGQRHRPRSPGQEVSGQREEGTNRDRREISPQSQRPTRSGLQAVHNATRHLDTIPRTIVLPSRSRQEYHNDRHSQTSSDSRHYTAEVDEDRDFPRSTPLFPRRTTSLQTYGSIQIHQHGIQQSPATEDSSDDIPQRHARHSDYTYATSRRNETDLSPRDSREDVVPLSRELDSDATRAVKYLCTIPSTYPEDLHAFLKTILKRANQSWVDEGLRRFTKLKADEQDREANLALRNTTLLHMCLQNRRWRDDLEDVEEGDKTKFKKHLNELQTRLKERSRAASLSDKQDERRASLLGEPHRVPTNHRSPPTTSDQSPSNLVSQQPVAPLIQSFFPGEGVHREVVRPWANELFGPDARVERGRRADKEGYFLSSRKTPDKTAMSILLERSKRKFDDDRKASVAPRGPPDDTIQIPVRPMSKLADRVKTRVERDRPSRDLLYVLPEVELTAANSTHTGVIDWAELAADLEYNLISWRCFESIGGLLRPGQHRSYRMHLLGTWPGYQVYINIGWATGKSSQVPFMLDAAGHDFGLILGQNFMREHGLMTSGPTRTVSHPAGAELRIRTYQWADPAHTRTSVRVDEDISGESHGASRAIGLRHAQRDPEVVPKPRGGGPQPPAAGDDLSQR